MATKTKKKPFSEPAPKKDPPFNLDREMKALYKHMDELIGIYKKQIQEFKAKLDKNPFHALSWSGGAMFAAANLELYKRYDPLRELDCDEAMDRLTRFMEQETREMLEGYGRHFNNSTNGICDQIYAECRARVHRDMFDKIMDIKRRQPPNLNAIPDWFRYTHSS